ncbi:peptide MFS transporter [Sphingomonas sp.]|uniref:peptide MFS transporter n=1 Tax=Sphingomonas sp. TaxID=28214 RepID=UPI003AFF8901
MVLPQADATTAPLARDVSRSDGDTWLGHPRQLARLFTVEMWERFGFYGLRALLVLYLTQHFLLSDHEANGVVGGYLSLAYLTPVVGGWVADRYLGSKRSVKLGAILMSLGYLVLCFGGPAATPYAEYDGQRHVVTMASAGNNFDPGTRQYVDAGGGRRLIISGNADGSVDLKAIDGSVVRHFGKGGFSAGGERSRGFVLVMLLALSIVAVGMGLFKPNISTVVGALYPAGDQRRDAGFTIFYWGINLGSVGSQTLCPLFVGWFGWWAGFLIVAVGMMIAYLLMRFDGGRLAGYGEPPPQEKDRFGYVLLGAAVAVPIIMAVLWNVMQTPEAAPGAGFVGYLAALPVLGKVLMAVFLAAVIGIPVWSFRAGGRDEAQMMLAAIILVVFNVTFWTLFEQAASSLTLFADRSTDLTLFGVIHMSAPQTQNFNPITIVVFAPIMSWLWTVLARFGREPSIPVKFGLALVIVGLGFVVLAASGHFAGADFKVGLWWLALTYFLHSIAELLISPVGLSMITKLAMARVVGMMMGVWFLSISVAEYLAGAIAQGASVQTVGGQVTNAELALHTYLASFQTGGMWTIGAGVLLLVLTPLLKRLMHGVQ